MSSDGLSLGGMKFEHDSLLVFGEMWRKGGDIMTGASEKESEREMKHKNHINNFITTNLRKEGAGSENSREHNSGTGLMNKMTIK